MPGKNTALSKEHKEAMQKGRLAANAVKRYLSIVIDGVAPVMRQTNTASRDRKLAELNEKLAGAVSSVEKLDLMAKKRALESGKPTAAAAATKAPTTEELERDFVANAKYYADSKGLSADDFAALGVPADIIKKAKLK